MRPRIVALLLGLVALVVSGTATADAQTDIPRSPPGGVTQQVGRTQIEVRYRRLVARGRDLFGELVPFGRVWTPSADTSAVFTVSAPIEVNGEPLPAGSYGIWAIPEEASWTIIFSRVPAAFHLRYPQNQDALRVTATPEQGEHVETLQFEFPLVDADSALFRLRWGTTVIPMKIRARSGG